MRTFEPFEVLVHPVGPKIKNARIEKEICLRTCAEDCGMAPSRLSKIDRGCTIPTQQEIDKLLAYLKPDEKQTAEIRELSLIPSIDVPRRIVTEKEFAGRLPIFFCSCGENENHTHQPMTDEQLDGILDMIKESMLE